MASKLLLLSAMGALAAGAAPPVCHEGGQCEDLSDVVDDTSLIQQGMRVVHGGSIGMQLAHHQPTDNVTDTAAEASGVSMNAEGDLMTFLTGLVMYSFASLFLVTVFVILRRRYPLIYYNNVLKGFAPREPNTETWLGWASGAWQTTTEEAAKSIGLDNAMLLEFCNLCRRILLTIGLPMVVIIGPMHYVFGGNAAGQDYLSYFSFGNVQNGSWLYWVHSVVVWAVVFTVQVNIYSSQTKFLKMRFKWLREMKEPRATTVLVESIPEKYCSDAELRGFFETMFDKKTIKEVNMVKYTATLEAAVYRKENAKYYVQKYTNKGDTARVEQYQKEIQEADKEITTERAKIKSECKEVGGVNTSCGFVTFTDRCSAEVAKMVQLSADSSEWSVSTPPDSSSVIWSDLQMDPSKAAIKTFIGYALVAGLYIVYLPLVIWITTVATKINLGPFQSIWASVAPTLGLQVMVAFLPTMLIWIFRLFFVLRDEAWEQHRLQNWYFVFNVVFVIMVTAIGSNVIGFSKTVATFFCAPTDTFILLGTAMPQATHFYMNFMVLQWMTHSLNLTRYIQWSKFKAFSTMFEEEEARELSEPEDQDYYGLGSRSARFTTNMLIGIIYGTLCPWMYILTWMNFFVCRTHYGYLIPFAETKKADLGGVFWVQKLKHLFVGNIIYVMMMTGVLYGRASTSGPAWISGFSIFYVIYSYYRFCNAFAWEKLPFEEIKADKFESSADDGSYTQPCLVEG